MQKVIAFPAYLLYAMQMIDWHTTDMQGNNFLHRLVTIVSFLSVSDVIVSAK